jgi:ankyrin repeat protein
MKSCMKAREFRSLAVELVRHAFKHHYINNLVVCLQHEIKEDSRNRDGENSSKETDGSGGTSGFEPFILHILSICTDNSGQNAIFRLVALATTQLISRRLLKSLLESGADPNILDMKGDNLLCHYLANPHYQSKKMTLSLDVVDLLLTHNVNVNHQNRLGFPPVHLSSLLSRLLLTELLLEHGARAEDVIDVRVRNQRTALHSAVELADERLILLWSEDVDPWIIDMTDKDGCTALHLASQQGHSAIVSILLKRADKTMANNDGLTALQLASEVSNRHVLASGRTIRPACCEGMGSSPRTTRTTGLSVKGACESSTCASAI